MRALKLALLTLALVPTTWLHGERPDRAHLPDAGLVDLMPALRGDLPDTGALRLLGAWQIIGRSRTLGTLSSLAQTRGGLVSVGDRGGVLWFSRPDFPGPWRHRLDRLIHVDWRRFHYPTDSEAVVVLPGAEDLLVAYEGVPQIERYSHDLTLRHPITLPVLSEWPENQGPEGMAVLGDGRTVIVGETYDRWLDRTRHPGLIFRGIPQPFETPARFELIMPAGYRPSELTQMPDGRLLVLGRNFSLAGFRSIVAVFSPRDVRPGAEITPRVIARITDPRIRDNYEGMTVTREADGSEVVWLVSDSNEMSVMQRTLLLKLRIGPDAGKGASAVGVAPDRQTAPARSSARAGERAGAAKTRNVRRRLP
ncbi:esterase-like activity of phytase family protein [Novosphingobium sp.]|uniref:esterase-like activity of phytase family protein n=1 Tax=Novosphingobium sp. TaxID=1874826 RepID=UPI003BA9F718